MHVGRGKGKGKFKFNSHLYQNMKMKLAKKMSLNNPCSHIETRRKISATLKGRKLPNEVREKISAGLYKAMTPEVRAKISAGNKGKKLSDS